MGEEIINPKKSEMTPQEDGTKVPLTDDVPVTIEEAKYVSDANGDAKVDIGTPQAFSGLTKEELMKYSNDPFWVRVRWFLFILFWLSWVAMLVLAIVIIIQAPGCKPPPELLAIEEEPMIKLLQDKQPDSASLLSTLKTLSIGAVYLSQLISPTNFREPNYDAKQLIKDLTAEGKQIATDLPDGINENNPFFIDASLNNLIDGDGKWNYSNDALAESLFSEIIEYWGKEGVTGFLLNELNTNETMEFKDQINKLTEPIKVSVSGNIVDAEPESLAYADALQDFLEDRTTAWSFPRFTSRLAVPSRINMNELRLSMMGIYLSPGTPIWDTEAIERIRSFNETAGLLTTLTNLRRNDAIKFGETNFANATGNVVAFTRTYKGTPAFAVALNLSPQNVTVSFADSPYIAETATVEVRSLPENKAKSGSKKLELKNIQLSEYEGIVLQFVGRFK